MEFSQAKADNDTDQPAVRTAKVLQCIANSLEPCIQLTFDTPDMNPNGKMPVLDLEIWTENTVRHTFYKKQVSSEFTILNRSALSESTKLNTVFMETYRRIVNCDSMTPWEEVEEHISRHANTMRISGYTKSQRYHTVKGAIERYREMSSKVKVGTCESIYRSGIKIKEAKRQKMDIPEDSKQSQGRDMSVNI